MVFVDNLLANVNTKLSERKMWLCPSNSYYTSWPLVYASKAAQEMESKDHRPLKACFICQFQAAGNMEVPIIAWSTAIS